MMIVETEKKDHHCPQNPSELVDVYNLCAKLMTLKSLMVNNHRACYNECHPGGFVVNVYYIWIKLLWAEWSFFYQLVVYWSLDIDLWCKRPFRKDFYHFYIFISTVCLNFSSNFPTIPHELVINPLVFALLLWYWLLPFQLNFCKFPYTCVVTHLRFCTHTHTPFPCRRRDGGICNPFPSSDKRGSKLFYMVQEQNEFNGLTRWCRFEAVFVAQNTGFGLQ